LAEPNPDDPLDTDIAEVYVSDRKKYEAKVKEFVTKYAS
jgi:ubiquitin-protein ligase